MKKYFLAVPVTVLALALTGCNSSDYKQSLKLFESNNFQEAAAILGKLKGYEDSEKYLQYCNAMIAAEAGKFEEAFKIFEGLKGFLDSDSRNIYYQAEALNQSGTYEDIQKAKELLASIPDFLDSQDKITAADASVEALYEQAVKLLEDKDFEAGYELLNSMKDYKDAAKLMEDSLSERAAAALEEGSFEDAKALFEQINELTGNTDKADFIKYCDAMKSLQDKDIPAAVALLSELEGFMDASEVLENLLNEGKALFEEGKFEEAAALLGDLAGYGDADKLAKAAGVLGNALAVTDTENEEAYAEFDEYIKTASAEELLKVLGLNDKILDAEQAPLDFIMKSIGQRLEAEPELKDVAAEYGRLEQKADYVEAKKCLNAGEFAKAYALLEAIPEYEDSAELIKNSREERGIPGAEEYLVGKTFANADGSISFEDDKTIGVSKMSADSAETQSDGYFVEDVSDKILISEESEMLNGPLTVDTENGIITDADGNQYQAADNWYKEGMSLMEEGLYEDAVQKFNLALGNAEAEDQIRKCYEAIAERDSSAAYKTAEELMEAGSFEEAVLAFEALGDYADSKDMIEKCRSAIEERQAAEQAAQEEAERQAAEQAALEEAQRQEAYQAAKELMEAGSFKEAKEAFEALEGYEDSQAQAEACEEAIIEAERQSAYQAAKDLMEAGSFEEAKEAFAALGEYEDSQAQAEACEEAIIEAERQAAYQAAQKLLDDGAFEEAKAAFEALEGYADSQDKIELCITGIKDGIYADALNAISEGDYIKAYNLLSEISGYKDADDQRAVIEHSYRNDLIKNAAYGDIVTFGVYEQDNDLANGSEPIEWIVLDNKDGKVLMVSENTIARMPFNEKAGDVDWDNSSLKYWLNHSFADKAFNADEIKCLAEADSIAVLSSEEIELYMPSAEDRKAESTEYSKNMGQGKDDGSWWTNAEGTYVDSDGIIVSDENADGTAHSVRPAVWVNVAQLGIYSEKLVENNGQDSAAIMAMTDEPVLAYDVYGFNQKDSRLAGVLALCGNNAAAVSGSDVVIWGNGNSDIKSASYFTDIVSVCIGGEENAETIYCLKADGTVLAAGLPEGQSKDFEKWTDIVEIACGSDHLLGLKADGTVVACGVNDHDQCFVKGWTNVVSIAAGSKQSIAAKSNGKVYCIGDNDFGEMRVKYWRNVVSVASGGDHNLGLKNDGTVIATGSNENGQCDVKEWNNIVAVAAGPDCSVGLKSDGTVISTIKDEAMKAEIESWTDIVAIAAGKNTVAAVKSDGSIQICGDGADMGIAGAVIAPKTSQSMLQNKLREQSNAKIALSNTVKYVQNKLNQLGYESGPVDGLHGPITTAACKAFQADKGLEITGQLSTEMLQILNEIR